jgi:hypothetical protein
MELEQRYSVQRIQDLNRQVRQVFVQVTEASDPEELGYILANGYCFQVQGSTGMLHIMMAQNDWKDWQAINPINNTRIHAVIIKFSNGSQVSITTPIVRWQDGGRFISFTAFGSVDPANYSRLYQVVEEIDNGLSLKTRGMCHTMQEAETVVTELREQEPDGDFSYVEWEPNIPVLEPTGWLKPIMLKRKEEADTSSLV